VRLTILTPSMSLLYRNCGNLDVSQPVGLLGLLQGTAKIILAEMRNWGMFSWVEPPNICLLMSVSSIIIWSYGVV
jgi:hypothetical protein